MPGEIDIKALIDGGQLDRKTIENLKAADPAEMREMLETYLPPEEVDGILGRIEQLVAASDAT